MKLPGSIFTPSPRLGDLWTYYAAAFVVLAAPLVQFLIGNHYPLASREAIILFAIIAGGGFVLGTLCLICGKALAAAIIGGLVALGLDVIYDLRSLRLMLPVCLLAAWLLRTHLSLIVTVGGTVLLATTIALPVKMEPHQTVNLVNSLAMREDADLPVILHIILDEHTGIIGLTEDLSESNDLAKSLEEFYVNLGFRLYTRAYSQYVDTVNAVPNLLNFSSLYTQKAYLSDTELPPFHLKTSKYFETLTRKGYSFNIYQSGPIDYCRVPNVRVLKCITYGKSDIGVLPESSLSVPERVKFIGYAFVKSSYRLSRTRNMYNKLRAQLSIVPLPEWHKGPVTGAPLSTLKVMQSLARDLETASRGHMYFAHLLLPHSPYILDSTCKLRPQISSWFNRYVNTDDIVINSPAVRREQYQRYYSQIECLKFPLRLIFNALKTGGKWKDAIVVVHGDHGSRLFQHSPTVSNASRLTENDFRDAYSTLFAIRQGSQEGEVDNVVLPIQAILAKSMGFYWSELSPRVYLVENKKRMKAHDLLGF